MELKKGLYNIPSFQNIFDKKIEDIEKDPIFKDSAGGMILGRNLVAVDPDVLMLETPDNTFLATGITISNIGGYANKLQKLRKRVQGQMKSARDNTTGKGKISLAINEAEIKVDELGAESEWTHSQIEQSNLQGMNLVSDLIQGQNEVYLATVDEIGYVGGFGNEGLLNYSGFTTDTATGTAQALTGEELYQEITDLINNQRAGVNNIPSYSANTVVMPIDVMNECNNKFLNTAGGLATVMTALKANFADVSFLATFRAADVDGGGSITAAFNNTKQSMQMRIPVPLQIGEIIQRGSFSYHNEILARVGGLDINENEAGRLLSGL